MDKSSKKALSLVELIIVGAIMAILVVPTLNLMSSMMASQVDFNDSINSFQAGLDINERITSELREAAYLYPIGTYLTIPTKNSTKTVKIGDEAIAALIPTYNSSNSILQPSTDITRFKGVAFSIMPQSVWDGTNSNKYVLVETTFTTDLSVNEDDPLKITGTPTTNWTYSSSYRLGSLLDPARFDNLGTSAFNIDKNAITFGFVSAGKFIYFPSAYATKTVDDSSSITSITARNVR